MYPLLHLGKQFSTTCSAVSDSGVSLWYVKNSTLLSKRQMYIYLHPSVTGYWSCKHSATLYTWVIRTHEHALCPVLPVSGGCCFWPAQHPFLSHCPAGYVTQPPLARGGVEEWMLDPSQAPLFAYLGLCSFRWGHSPIPL